ncbi:MAG: chromate efflux transporter [Verrucomicrobiota bacterium]
MAPHPTFREALRFWLKLGLISFGGPAGQIAIMQQELVERKKWIGQDRFLHALNFCMLLPGPEAQQLAIYCGWLLHRAWGGIAAGVLFVLPSALLLWGLGFVYVTYGDVGWLAAFFDGLKPAVLAIVVAAVLRIGQKSLRTPARRALAAAAFVLIFFMGAPFPLIVLGAALIGWLGGRRWPAQFEAGAGMPVVDAGRAAVDDAAENAAVQPGWRRTLRVTGLCLLLWAAPIVAAGWWQGWDGTLAGEGLFFSKAAMVTFGGAYAVLPYVAQQAVEQHGWLSAPQMLDGLALAETTPGPLIMVVQFAGFLGGWNHPGELPPLLSATLGAAITTWVTFTPCFLWIFLGAPHIERLRGNRAIGHALGAVTAGVVGVILNLAVWFGWHVIVPGDAGLDVAALSVGLGAFTALHVFRVNLMLVIAVCGLAGVGLAWL